MKKIQIFETYHWSAKTIDHKPFIEFHICFMRN